MVISYKNSEYLGLRKGDSETLGSCGYLTFSSSLTHYLSPCLAPTNTIAPLQEAHTLPKKM